jgi:hypothetical protein
MSTYFKYTDGESFTLNGSDYVGFFHVLNGIPYTLKETGNDSLELTPKTTFLSDIYTNQYHLDNTYSNITDIRPNYTNCLDVLDKQGIDDLLVGVNDNNLICIKGMILSNPIVYNYSKNGCHFYGLEFGEAENSTRIPYKQGYYNIEPFSNTNKWSGMDNIKAGNITVDTYEDFKYICADEESTYVFSGNFTNTDPLKLLSKIDNDPFYDVTHQIHNDYENSKMLFVKNDFISVYDTSNYMNCGNLILMDQIPLTPTDTTVYKWDTVDQTWEDVLLTWDNGYSTINSNNPEFIKFGKNIRTSITDNVLNIIDKYSSEVYQVINLSNYKILEVLGIDVRVTDDFIAIVYKDATSKINILVFDPSTNTEVINSSIESIDSSRDYQRVKFSEVDSNIIHTYNDKEFQTRFISNIEYPAGRLENGDLSYLKDYIWSKVDETWDYIPINWDYEDSASNSYNNILISTYAANNKMYMLAHNIGRIYAFNQPIIESLYSSIPIDLEKYFTGVNCSESSIGLYLNHAFSNVLKDVINIFNKNYGKFTIGEREVYLEQIDDIAFTAHNLYINGNETINVIALQRILTLITEMQSKLIPTSS